MILLKQNDSLTITSFVTGIPFTAVYEDIGKDQNISKQQVNMGTVTGLVSPTILLTAISNFPNINYVAIRNSDAADQTFTVSILSGVTYTPFLKVTLNPDDTLFYEDDRGWYALNSQGEEKTSASGGSPTIITTTDVETSFDYPIIGYKAFLQNDTYTIPGDWTFPSDVVVYIDTNPNWVGTASSSSDLVTQLNLLGLGIFVLVGSDITAAGHHDYGDMIQLTGAAVDPSGVMDLDISSPVAITDILGFSCRRMSQKQIRATDVDFLALMQPINWLFSDPWPDPHSQWYHVKPLGGGDGPNYLLSEAIARGKTLATVQDGIGDITYGWDWFIDYANTMQALSVTQGIVAVNLASLLIQQIKTYQYTYLIATTASDPTAGKLKFNNATVSSATSLFISETDGAAVNIGARIAGWQKVTFYQNADPTIYSIFSIGTVTDNGAWDTLTLTHIASAGTLANNDPITIIVTNEANPDPVNVAAINYTNFQAEFNFMVTRLATAGVSVRRVQMTLEMGIQAQRDLVHSATDYYNICNKVITDFFIPSYPALPRSADAYTVDDSTPYYPTYNAVMATLNVYAMRQYYHFWDYLTTYQQNRDRIQEYPSVITLFQTAFPGKKMIITQCPCKAGNPFRNKVGEGLIFVEMMMMVLKQNQLNGNMVPDMSFYDESRLISGNSNTIYPAVYFITLARNMFINNGECDVTFTNVDQSSSLVTVTVKQGTKGHIYILNPTAFSITIPAIKLGGVNKNVSVESYYGDPSDSAASHYFIAIGATALLQPFSLTLIKTL